MHRLPQVITGHYTSIAADMKQIWQVTSIDAMRMDLLCLKKNLSPVKTSLWLALYTKTTRGDLANTGTTDR
jgi:hypothetical protein